MVFYSFELMMAGIILFSAMISGGLYMFFKKRRNSTASSLDSANTSSGNTSDTSNE